MEETKRLLDVRCMKRTGRPRKRFRIVKMSSKKYRVEYLRKIFGFIPFWDKQLHEYWQSAGLIEDGYEKCHAPLIFESLEDAKVYIDKASRKIICFRKDCEIVHN